MADQHEPWRSIRLGPGFQRLEHYTSFSVPLDDQVVIETWDELFLVNLREPASFRVDERYSFESDIHDETSHVLTYEGKHYPMIGLLGGRRSPPVPEASASNSKPAPQARLPYECGVLTAACSRSARRYCSLEIGRTRPFHPAAPTS